jgi:thioesterase domain-containing protein
MRRHSNTSESSPQPASSPATASIWRLISKKNNIIIRLSEGEAGLPFYCVHPLGGDVASYRQFVSALGPHQQIYGIQATKSVLHSNLTDSIELLAQHYVDALRSFQPHGPLVLGGWSVGAPIALDMARQLQAVGRQVPLLVILDGILANVRGGIQIWDPRYYWRLASNIPKWIVNDLIEERRKIARRARARLSAILRIADRRGKIISNGHKIDTFVDTTGWLPEQISFARRLYAANEAYVPRPYNGRVIVYAAKTQPLFHLLQVEATWGKVCSAMETVRIDGTHLSFLYEPRVSAVASDLRSRLEQLPIEHGPEHALSHPPMPLPKML